MGKISHICIRLVLINHIPNDSSNTARQLITFQISKQVDLPGAGRRCKLLETPFNKSNIPLVYEAFQKLLLGKLDYLASPAFIVNEPPLPFSPPFPPVYIPGPKFISPPEAPL